MTKCTHVREDGSSCWEYCGPVKRRWWQFWAPAGLAWWLCSRCEAAMQARAQKAH